MVLISVASPCKQLLALLSIMARTPVSYAEVFQYLSKAKKYAEGCSDARQRSIRRFAKNIALEDGTLFYLHKDKGQIHKRRWISDKKVQQEIIVSVHDNVAGWLPFWTG